ncbi:CopM family metallochaperone [Ancylobacter polymorphus]|uniref:DUF305 domain-containing protein n=1 Tax=Ancylobacter polymorphus TaxID=223390 RepID=A0A9E7A0M0_9HYPH|nr:DUF305 domain-containing protein [Ancylobacter polymorphus]UOK73801.1 DUF305 domain-containing protein [Ancylobacter polymorphus]
MSIHKTLVIAALAMAPTTAVIAQDSMLPAACTASSPMKMDSMNMDNTAMGEVDEAHKAFMNAMMKMHPAMMQGISAKDTDVAFTCGMIAHHQGAIDMARVELKYGKDQDARKKAQMIIDAQTKEIEEFTKWLSVHAQ